MAWRGGPAGVEEQGMHALGFPRNLGGPVASVLTTGKGIAGTKTPGPWVGALLNPWERNRSARAVLESGGNEFFRMGNRESEPGVVPMKRGNLPQGTLSREGRAESWNRWRATWREHRVSNPCQRNCSE